MSGPTDRRPVTVLATRTVQVGREREFESFPSELQDVFADAPGHLRLTIICPEPPDREYTLVYQFDSRSSLLAWERSDERAAAAGRHTGGRLSWQQAALALGSMVVGLITSVSISTASGGPWPVIVIWIAITVINMAIIRSGRPSRRDRRSPR